MLKVKVHILTNFISFGCGIRILPIRQLVKVPLRLNHTPVRNYRMPTLDKRANVIFVLGAPGSGK